MTIKFKLVCLKWLYNKQESQCCSNSKIHDMYSIGDPGKFKVISITEVEEQHVQFTPENN